MPCLQLAKLNSTRNEVPLLLFNLPPHFMVTDDVCFMAQPNPPILDVCDWPSEWAGQGPGRRSELVSMHAATVHLFVATPGSVIAGASTEALG